MADVFYNVVLPDQYSYGATFGPRFKTNIVMVNSGKEQRNADWQDALWEISINYTTKRKEEVQDIENLFLQTKGPLIPFLFNSKKDNEVTLTQGIANSDGVLKGHPKFRLFKTYVFEPSFTKYNKRIFKPVPASVQVYNNGVLTGWTVDYLNGTVELPVISSKEITAITKATNGQITAIGHGFTTGNKIYLDNITGMTQLNKMVVTVVSVIDADNFTININTLSYSTFTYTALTSYAKKYITGTENITWSGQFYLPVRFKEDVITTSYDTFNSLSVSVTLVELRLDEVNEEQLDD